MENIAIALTIFAIIVSIAALLVGTDNIWNVAKFNIHLSNEPDQGDQTPVDEIIQVITKDPIDTADWFRDRDIDVFRQLKTKYSPNDAWVIDRIYHSDTNGLRQKITITNEGMSQAHDVIIQILGVSNFKIIDYNCPEILSDEQITKNMGKNILLLNLECLHSYHV